MFNHATRYAVSLLFISALSWAESAEHTHEASGTTQNQGKVELRQSITQDEAKNLFAELAANRKFRMLEPGAHCYHRSQLIGRYLEQKKIFSNQLYIDCHGELIRAVTPETGVYAQYGDHWTNVLWVTGEHSPKAKPYVFDPQFRDSPVPLEEYVNALVSPGISMKHVSHPGEKQKPCECSYRLVDRRSYQELRNGIWERREKQQEALGLTDIYGRDVAMDLHQRKKLESQLEPLAEWFDSRISWDNPSLLRHAKQVDEWNKALNKSPELQQAIKKFKTEKLPLSEITHTRRLNALKLLIDESQRRRAELEAYWTSDTAFKDAKALKEQSAYRKESNEEEACLNRELRVLNGASP